MKLTYLHCYADDLWEGYEKNGLLRENFGIRFPQSIHLPEELMFNELAKKDGKLYNYVKEHRCAFYIDRLQGGSVFQNYEYDEDLLNEYEDMLGDNFLGFQMHEWFSNYRSEIFSKLKNVPADAWTEENILAEIRRKYPIKHLFIESMSLQEMAACGRPQSAKELYDNATQMYKRRLQKYKKLVPCDSYFMMFPFEAQNGAKLIMPEVGAQSPDMRIQMCFARGVTRAYGISLGAYYEPWGGEPFSACNYQADEKNEWWIGNEDDFPFLTEGPNGGSSRSLQWRVHLYAYLCNADYICEEWGGYNTFKNRETYELSEYGLVKKRFLDFVDKYSDLGEKVVPIGAILSNDELCFTLRSLEWTLEDDAKTLFWFPLQGKELERWQKLKFDVEKIFSNKIPQYGNQYERQCLLNSDVPDAVDLLDEGDGRALKKYDYLVNLTGDPAFEKRYENCITPDQVTEVLHEILPCKVLGGLHYVINRRGENGYYLSIFNHNGVYRSVAQGDTFAPEATKTVCVELKDNRVLKALEGSKDVVLKDGKYYVTVKGGDWFFGAF